MKKFVILSILIAVGLTSQSQKSYLGACVGVNQTNITPFNTISSRNPRAGLVVGIQYQRFLTEHFSLIGEVAYNQRRFSEYFSTYSYPYVSTVMTIYDNFNYVTVPLKVGYSYGERLYGFANVGVVPAFLISAQSIQSAVTLNGVYIPRSVHEETNKLNRFDVGGIAQLGVGYRLESGNSIFISATYQQSLTQFATSQYLAYNTSRFVGAAILVGYKSEI
jgi:hypothetical protein